MKILNMEKYADYPKPLRKHKYKFIFLMLLPSLASFAVFYVAINLQSILLAFREFTGYTPDGGETYIWSLENFRNIFRELNSSATAATQLLQATKNTLLLYFFGNIITFPLACVISYYIWKKMPAHKLFRIVFYLPHIISSVVMVIIFKNIVAPNGLFGALSVVFTGHLSPPFLAQDKTAIWFVLLYNTWMGFAGPYLLITAALMRVPQDVIESAQLDGITPFKEFTKICVPLVWPTIYIILLQKIAGLLAADGPILLLTNGTASTYTLGFWSYMQVVVSHSYEFPAAVGILMTLVVAPLALLARWLMSLVNKDIEY